MVYLQDNSLLKIGDVFTHLPDLNSDIFIKVNKIRAKVWIAKHKREGSIYIISSGVWLLEEPDVYYLKAGIL